MSNVYWITGLSGAGKTTLATLLTNHLKKRVKSVFLLDGDAIRTALGSLTNHKRADRLALAYQYAGLAKMIADQGSEVVVATVSLFDEIHSWNRLNLPSYYEIYLKVDISELRRRDAKGIYARFDSGDLSDLAGLDLPIDEPKKPNLRIDFYDGLTPDATLKIVLEAFERDKKENKKEIKKNDR